MLADKSQAYGTPPATPKQGARSLSRPTSKSSLADTPAQKENLAVAPHDIYMDTARGLPPGLPDVRMGTAKGGMTYKNDVHMETYKGATSNTTVKHGGLRPWEKLLVDAPEVKRKATVAQLCE